MKLFGKPNQKVGVRIVVRPQFHLCRDTTAFASIPAVASSASAIDRTAVMSLGHASFQQEIQLRTISVRSCNARSVLHDHYEVAIEHGLQLTNAPHVDDR